MQYQFHAVQSKESDIPRRPFLSIMLFGEFQVTGPENEDLTPRSSKTQGLLALLATARDMRRGRAWLQDRLWSDRGPKQASGSLRQAIHDLKRELGPFATVLKASRTSVSLDRSAVVLKEKPHAPLAEVEFLMGIDLKDPEFEEWLREMRTFHAGTLAQSRQARPSRRRAVQVALLGSTPEDRDLSLLEAIFLDLAQRSLSELLDVEFSFGLPNQGDLEANQRVDILLRVQGVKSLNGDRWLRVGLEDPKSLRSHWTHQVSVSAEDALSPENHACTTLTYRTVERFISLMRSENPVGPTSSEFDANRLAASAFKKMFTMRAENVNEAYDLLTAAIEIRPRGLFDAWRAQVNTIRHVEQQVLDVEGLRDESTALIRHALEAEPMNSNVMAAAANTRLIFENDILQAGILSRQAVVLNRSNPLAWWAWSNANLYGGDFDIAYSSAITAQALGTQSSIEFWTSFQAALTAAVQGRLNEAVSYSTLSNALAPSFRPPLRYLAAIAARTGRIDDAVRSLSRLSDLETGFSVDRMVNDPTYPVSMMHRAKLIDPDALLNVFERKDH